MASFNEFVSSQGSNYRKRKYIEEEEKRANGFRGFVQNEGKNYKKKNNYSQRVLEEAAPRVSAQQYAQERGVYTSPNRRRLEQRTELDNAINNKSAAEEYKKKYNLSDEGFNRDAEYRRNEINTQFEEAKSKPGANAANIYATTYGKRDYSKDYRKGMMPTSTEAESSLKPTAPANKYGKVVTENPDNVPTYTKQGVKVKEKEREKREVREATKLYANLSEDDRKDLSIIDDDGDFIDSLIRSFGHYNDEPGSNEFVNEELARGNESNAARSRLKSRGYTDSQINAMSILYRQEKNKKFNDETYMPAVEKFAEEHPVGASIASVAMKPIMAPAGVAGKAQERMNAQYNDYMGRGVDSNNPLIAMAAADNDIRQKVMETQDMSKLGSEAYMLGMSTADTIVNTAMGMMFGGALVDLGVAGNVGAKLAAKYPWYNTVGRTLTKLGLSKYNPISGSIFGLSAQADKLRDPNERLAAKDQLSTATAAMIFETLCESVSIGNLDFFDADVPAKTIGQLLNQIFIKNGIPNATEEGITNLSNKLYDAAHNKENSEYKMLMSDYLANNPGATEKEARRYALSQMGVDILRDTIGGYIQGVMLGGAKGAVNFGRQNISYGKEGKQLRLGEDYSEGAIANTLAQNGYGEQAAASLAKDITDAATGKTISQRAQDTINGSEYLTAILNETRAAVAENTETFREAAEDIGVKSPKDTNRSVARAIDLSLAKTAEDTQVSRSDLYKEFREQGVGKIQSAIEARRAESIDRKLGKESLTNVEREAYEKESTRQALENAQSRRFAENENEIAAKQRIINTVRGTSDIKNNVSSTGRVTVNGTDSKVKNYKITDVDHDIKILTDKNGKKSSQNVTNIGVEVTFADGTTKTVSSDDIYFASTEEARVMDVIDSVCQRTDIDTETANFLLASLPSVLGNTSTEAAVVAIKTAYDSGKYDLPLGMYGEASVGVLGVNMFNAIRQSGASVSLGNTQAADEAVKKAIRAFVTNPSESVKGTVMFRGKQINSEMIDNDKSLSDAQKDALRTQMIIADVTGIKIVADESTEATRATTENGWFAYDKGEGGYVIHADMNSGVDGQGAVLFTMAHELTHFIKTWSPTQFDNLANFALNHLDEDFDIETSIKAQQDAAARAGEKLSRAAAYEEVICNAMQTMLSDDKKTVVSRLAELNKENPELFNKLQSEINRIGDAAAKKHKELEKDRGAISNIGRAMAQVEDSIGELRSMFAEALQEAGQNFKAAGGAEISQTSSRGKSGIIPQFVQRVNELNENKKYSRRVTETDQKYFDAIEKYGEDSAEVWKMSRDAARQAGYTETTYHGTRAHTIKDKGFGFTTILSSAGDDGRSFFMAGNIQTAETYSDYDGVRKISETDESVLKKNEETFQNAVKDVEDKAYELTEAINRFSGIRDFLDYGRLSDYADRYMTGIYSDEQIWTEMYEDLMEDLAEAWEASGDDEYSDFADWQMMSDEGDKLCTMCSDFVDATIESLNIQAKMDDTSRGNYQFYVNTDGWLVIDGNKKNWKNLGIQNDDGSISNTTRQVAERAYNDGYRGVIIEGIYDFGSQPRGDAEASDIYISFYPQEDVKSADPVTYDDNGNVIPLSERFNPKNEDIRYSRRISEETEPTFDDYIDSASDEEIKSLVDEVDARMENRLYVSDNEEQREIYAVLDEMKRAKDELFNGNEGEIPEDDEFWESKTTPKNTIDGTRVINKGRKQKVKKESIYQIVRKYKRDYSVKGVPLSLENTDKITDMLSDLHDYVLNGEDVAWDEVYKKARDIAIETVKYTNYYTDTHWAGAGKSRKLIKQRFRRDNPYGVYRETHKALIDENGKRIWDEADLEGNPVNDKYATFGETFELYDNETQRGLAQKTITDLTNEIVSDIFDTPISNAQAIKDASIRAKYENRIKELKLQMAQIQSDAKKETQQKVKEQRRKDVAYYQQRIKEIREDRDQKILALKALRYQRDVERREFAKRRDYRAKIIRKYEKLSRMLTNPTESQHVPAELVHSIADFLGDVSANLLQEQERADGTIIKKRERNNTRLMDLVAAYDKIKTDYEGEAVYDETVHQILEEASKAFGNKTIDDMDSYELEDVNRALAAIEHTIRSSLKATVEGKERDAYAFARKLVRQSEEGKKKSSNFFRRVLWSQLNPYSVFHAMSNYEDGGWMDMYKILNEGQLKQTQIQVDVVDAFKELMDNKELDKLSDYNKGLVDVGLVGENGQPVEITRGLMLALYLHLQNEQNRNHIAKGGLTLPNFAKYYKGDMEAWGNEVVRLRNVGGDLSYLTREIARLKSLRGASDSEDIKSRYTTDIEELEAQKNEIMESANLYLDTVASNIESQLTDYEKQFIEKAKWFFNEYSKEVLNDATMRMYGFKKATEENYMPIISDSDFLNASFESIVMDASLENMGFMKQRQEGASNAIKLFDLTDVINAQLNKVSKYAGLAPAIKEFNNIYNKQFFDEHNHRMSVQTASKQRFGQYGQNYIEYLLADLQGGRKAKGSSNIFRALRGNSYQAALLLNLRVSMAQAGSYPTAAAEIGWKPLMKALAKGGERGAPISRADRELIDIYTPLLANRFKGGTKTDITNLKSKSKHTLSGLENRALQHTRALTDWISIVDTATVGRLWSAAEYYVDENFNLEKGTEEEIKNGESAYYNKVAEVFNRIVERTQPSYTTMQRPELLRNPNEALKFFTMFMTQRAQNFNLVYDAVSSFANQEQRRKSGVYDSTKYAEARQALTRTVVSQVVAGATLATMKALADALQHSMRNYKDDDDELTLLSILERIGKTFLESEVSNMIGGSELYTLAESLITGSTYYGITANVIGSIEDVSNAIKSIGDKGLNAKTITKLATSSGMILGIPASQMKKWVDAVTGWYKDIANGGEWFDDAEGTVSGESQKMVKAFLNGDTKRYQEIRESLKGENASTVKTAISNYLREEYVEGNLTDTEVRSVLTRVYGMSGENINKKLKEFRERKDGTYKPKESKKWGEE